MIDDNDQESSKKPNKSATIKSKKSIVSHKSVKESDKYSIDFLFSFEDPNFNIKTILQSNSSENFCSNLITIALLAKEEIIASIIVVEYP